MALTTPGGRGLGLRLDVPRDNRLWAWPVAPLTAPPPSPIDLRAGFPFAPQDQGQEGSCTAFAGCGALEWLLWANDTPGSAVKLAEAFTYFVNRREDGSATSQDVGASSQSIAKGMAQFGAADARLMPYRAGDWATAPSQVAYQDALGRRILRYYQVSGDLLGGVWAALAGGIVLCMGFQVPTSFETGVGADGKVPQPGGADRILGGHEIVCCGWFPDSTAPGGQGWVLCRNSWGTGMGLGGYYLVPTVYWQMGLVMDHMVLAFDNPPAPSPAPPPPAPEPDVNIEELDGFLAEAQNQLGNPPDGLRFQRPPTSASKQTWITWSDQVREKAGIAWDYMQQVRNALPKVDPPGPPAPGAAITGIAVTYAQHDPARDCYLGYSAEQVEWGPHHGIPLIAPADGTVSLYTFPTPLPVREGWGASYGRSSINETNYQRTHQALFGGPFLCGMRRQDLIAAGQTMYFVLYVPNAPLAGLKALWFGHARGNAKVGPVRQGEWFGESWDSGVHFESVGVDARAAHVHCCASASGALTMNGDVDGLRAAAAMGWEVQFIGSNGPGPDQYYTGSYCAGRLRSDFTQGGHPLPPVPS